MTEYEIADLALSKAMQLQGAVSQVQVQQGTMGDGIQLLMAVLFGFLASIYCGKFGRWLRFLPEAL